MKMYLISDNTDTLTGMRLIGVEGVIVHTKNELQNALDSAYADKNIGIVLITEKLAKDFFDIVSVAKLSKNLPLIMEIPDRHGTGRSKDFITSFISDAIGIRL